MNYILILYNKIKCTYQKNKVLVRLVMSYISIIILIVVSSMVAYFYTRHIVISKEIDNNKSNLYYTKGLIDQQMETLSTDAYLFLQNKHTADNLAITNNIYQQNAIVNELRKFKQKSSFIDNAILYQPNAQNILFDDGSLSNEYAFTKSFNYLDLSKESLFNIISNNESLGYIPTSKILIDSKYGQSAGNYLTMYFANFYSHRQDKLLLLINENKFLDFFNTLSTGSSFLIIDNDGQIIANSPDHIISEALSTELISHLNNKGTSNSFRYKDNLVVYQKSDFLSWNYITIQHYNNVVKGVNIIKFIFLCMITVVIMVCIIIIIISARVYYSPIKKILAYFDGENLVYNNEFDEIISNIDQLSYRNKEYESNESLQNTIKYGIYTDILNSIFIHKKLLVLCIMSNDIELISLFGSEIIDILTEINITESRYEKHHMYLILNSHEIVYDDILDKVSLLKENSRFDALMVGISPVSNSTKDLHNLCKASNHAIEQGPSDNTTGIYHFTHSKSNNIIVFPNDFEQNIRNFIYSPNKEASSKLILDIFEKNKSIPNDYMKHVILQFLNIYVQLADQFNVSYNFRAISNILEQEYRLSKITAYILELYDDLIPEDDLEQTSNQVGDFVNTYIQENYMDPDISIDSIASDLNLSASYVSTLFKKQTNVAFSQYLPAYRIEKAKFLLESTDMKIKDISTQIGFGTYNNFTRAFKKITGYSPSGYKAMLKHKDH